MSCDPTDLVQFVVPREKGRHPKIVCGGGDAMEIVGISEKSQSKATKLWSLVRPYRWCVL